MEPLNPTESEAQPDRDSRLEQLDTLARELEFDEPAELNELRLAVLVAIANGDEQQGIAAMTAYQIAARAWVMAQPQRSNAPIGYRITVASIWLESGKISDGLDELWETAYQAGQTPGIEPLRESLEEFVVTYDDTSE